MALNYKSGKDLLLGFHYGPLFSKVTEKIHYVCKSDIKQIRFTNKLLGLVLKGELNPNETKVTLENSQLFDPSQITIILSILTTDVLDPLKEALDAVYNNPAPGDVPISEPIPIVNSTPKAFEMPQPIPQQKPVESAGDIDPLDMFDKAKNDIRVTPQEGVTLTQKEASPVVEPIQNQTTPEDRKIDAPNAITEPAKDLTSINNSPIKINRAAILGDEENNNLLVLQNSQAITQLSQVLKNNTPVVEKEDLNLYVSSSELKEEAPKPLNPTVLTERDDGLETAEGVETGGALMAELGSAPTPNSGIMAIVDAQTAEPKENTMSENIAQSHLKFVQSDKQGIPENRSYSKLLNAMNQKPKNQPPVVGTLRTTFAHPDRYSESYEVPKPKPKKYTLTKDDSIRSSVISSTESSSNIKSNAIMEEAIENDIINLAKDISQERKTTDAKKVDTPHKPIIYNKQPIQKEDPFESINENKLSEKEKTKNSNIIDLS